MMDLLFTFSTAVGSNFIEHLSLARLFESVILLGLIWKKTKPILDKFEQRLGGIEKAVKEGFHAGEERFTRIETRLAEVETVLEREIPNV